MNKFEIIEKLNDIYLQRQQKSSAEHKERVDEVCTNHPDLQEALEERHAAILMRIKSNIGSMDKPQNDMRSLMEEKNQKIKALLVKYGYPEDYLQPQFFCPICKDEGKIYTPQTRECDCYIEAFKQLQYESMGFSKTEKQSFADFSLEVYSEEVLANIHKSQRAYMQDIYQYILQYAKEFPNNTKTTNNLVFIGKSGLGKTFFMHAIANEVLHTRKNIQFITAFKWFEMAKNSYFGNNVEVYNDLLQTDLLMIDDLGTEPLNENITIPQLFNLINERHNRGLHTILSTNLDANELRNRYTERITSRFEDRRFTTILRFLGNDVRRNIK